jgi:hypothetical protein
MSGPLGGLVDGDTTFVGDTIVDGANSDDGSAQLGSASRPRVRDAGVGEVRFRCIRRYGVEGALVYVDPPCRRMTRRSGT